MTKVNRVGERKLANNGQWMEIMEWFNNKNITVRFEDGTIREHVRYNHFLSGKVSPIYRPEVNKTKKQSRIGERRLMNCGEYCEIIEYINSHNITVKFDDETVLYKKYYVDFKNGLIKNPNYEFKAQKKQNKKQSLNKSKVLINRVGEENIANNGQKMTIIAYRRSDDIDVQFEDGTIVCNKAYNEFKKGQIANPNYNSYNRIGEKRKANNGQWMEIIEYFSYENITVKFEDGTIVYNKRYGNFKRGCISSLNCESKILKRKNPNYNPQILINRMGERNKSNNGQWMEIIEYFSYKNITVKFEDGTIVYNKRYDAFKRGGIGNPNYRIASGISCNEFVIFYYLKKYGFIKKEQGSLKELGFGQMELDCYHPDYKIAIEYDGEFHAFRRNTDIKKNKACKQNGITIIRIREPKCPILNDNSIEYRIDSNKRFSSNFEATLKEVFKYINSITELNVDENISFEQDKELILKEYNKLYANKYAKLRIGETKIANNGQKMTIIAYRSSIDIDIRFEDGTIVTNKTYSAFIKGQVPHDFKDRIGETIRANNGQEMTIIRWRKHIDIDVQFEDGTVVTNKRYSHFKIGNIKNPNFKKVA